MAIAFAGGVVAEGTVAGAQAARASLAAQTPLATSARVSWSGPVTPAIDAAARRALDDLGPAGRVRGTTEVLLLRPVRLSGTVVQPVAIAPLASWVVPTLAARLGPCRPAACPMLATRPVHATAFRAYGVRLERAGVAALSSAVPLGFAPAAATNFVSTSPILLTGDIRGLAEVPGLSGVYRTYTWVRETDLAHVPSWQLPALEATMARTQTRLAAASAPLDFSGPFDAIDAARAEARSAPRRLLLVGGGAVAVLAMFIVLAAGGLRADQRRELDRLFAAGATARQGAGFLIAESAAISAVAVIAGAALALLATVVLAHGADLPAGGVLAHSILTGGGALVAAGGWAVATALLVAATVAPGRRAADVLATLAVAALVVALALPASSDGAGTTPLLVAPLCCLAGAVIVARLAELILRAAERIARRGPLVVRLAVIGLARAPGPSALAIAFVMVSVGLAGFALSYRATLLRGTADEAAFQVPLDATVSPTPDFTRPLQLAPLSRWQTLAGGAVLPVRRTYATYLGGAVSVTVPALGVPAAALGLIHGWSRTGASAPASALARRLRALPATASDPLLPVGGGALALTATSPGIALSVTADLLGDGDALRQLSLGSTSPRRATVLRGRIPPGRWRLAGFQLQEPAGLEITNGHQNGENVAAATQATDSVTLGPATVSGAPHGDPAPIPLPGWTAVGATSGLRGIAGTSGAVGMQFSEDGSPGLVRPAQPSDTHPLPVLVDPRTAAAQSGSGRLALQIDGITVSAEIAGVLRRFPSIPRGSGGFVIADEAALAAALDGGLPGQGRADELWIDTRRPDRLRAALAARPLSQLGAGFRSSLQSAARSAPVARGVLGTLLAAIAVAVVLMVVGLLAAMLGPGRDRRVERDFIEQGMSPAALRSELQVRMAVASTIGVIAGSALAVLLTRLAVTSVRAALVSRPQPPLVAVVPAGALAAVALGGLVILWATGWLSARAAMR